MHKEKPLTYPYYICGLNTHKLTTCPKFNELQIVFINKGNQNVEKKHVFDVKVTITFMNMVDVHVTTTKRIFFEAQKFNDKEPLKNKSATY
jgi:hypothetical protein